MVHHQDDSTLARMSKDEYVRQLNEIESKLLNEQAEVQARRQELRQGPQAVPSRPVREVLRNDVTELIRMAARAGDSQDAMRYSQAAVNVANAVAQLSHLELLDLTTAD